MRSPIMRSAFAGIVSLVAAAGALADVWDNYPVTQDYPNGYDASVYLTSERNTQVGQGFPSATWIIEDATFEQPVIITGIEWIGLTEAKNEFGAPYSYSLADWGIFDGDIGDPNALSFTETAGESDVAYTREVLGVTNLTGFSTQEFEIYRGFVEFEGVEIAAGTHWFGTRLVGDPGNVQNGGTGGRALAAGASGNPGSTGEAYNSDGNFFPQWDRASERSVPGSPPIEFAYRIYYTVVPEPASLGLLAVVGLIGLRRIA